MSDIDIQTGDIVRRFRDHVNVSQAKLAHDLDISRPFLCQLELGERTWTVEMLLMVATKLGVKPALLLPRRPKFVDRTHAVAPTPEASPTPQSAPESAAS